MKDGKATNSELGSHERLGKLEQTRYTRRDYIKNSFSETLKSILSAYSNSIQTTMQSLHGSKIAESTRF